MGISMVKTPTLPPPLPLAFYRPPTIRERLELEAAKPLRPTKPQKALDVGLFDLGARNQEELKL